MEKCAGSRLPERKRRYEPGAASLYQHVAFQQDTTYLSIGERTNATGSKVFREAMLEDNYDDCIEIARDQTRDGAHFLDVIIDYVGRDGAARYARDSWAASPPLRPCRSCSTPLSQRFIETGLELLGGRAIINSVNYEDGEGPGSRIQRIMPLITEHGAAVVALTIDEQGQARTAEWKVASRRAPHRRPHRQLGSGPVRHHHRLPDVPHRDRPGRNTSRRAGDDRGDSRGQTRHPHRAHDAWPVQRLLRTQPAARMVLNSVFLHEAIQAGLDSAIVHASKILPMARIPDEQRQVALDLVYDRDAKQQQIRPAYDPLQRFMEIFEGRTTADDRQTRAAELAALPLSERLRRRIIDGERTDSS